MQPSRPRQGLGEEQGRCDAPSDRTTDLLVSYPWRHFRRARNEIRRRLQDCGDPDAQAEKTMVPGIAVVHTRLDGREVLRKCRALFEDGASFDFAVKWVPVDAWCETSLEAMQAVIEQRFRDQIGAGQTWAMKVEKRGWRQFHVTEIIGRLASAIDRKVDLRHPDRVVRIDVLGPVTAMSLLRPEEVFSTRVRRAG